eukprot:g4793.t1
MGKLPKHLETRFLRTHDTVTTILTNSPKLESSNTRDFEKSGRTQGFTSELSTVGPYRDTTLFAASREQHIAEMRAKAEKRRADNIKQKYEEEKRKLAEHEKKLARRRKRERAREVKRLRRKNAVTRIQRIVRPKIREKWQSRAATRIQAVQRGSKRRKKYRDKQNANVKLQTAFRKHNAQNTYRKKRKSAMILQRNHHRYMNRRLHWGAEKIQRKFRWFKLLQFRLLWVGSVIHIQRSYRENKRKIKARNKLRARIRKKAKKAAKVGALVAAMAVRDSSRVVRNAIMRVMMMRRVSSRPSSRTGFGTSFTPSEQQLREEENAIASFYVTDDGTVVNKQMDLVPPILKSLLTEGVESIVVDSIAEFASEETWERVIVSEVESLLEEKVIEAAAAVVQRERIIAETEARMKALSSGVLMSEEIQGVQAEEALQMYKKKQKEDMKRKFEEERRQKEKEMHEELWELKKMSRHLYARPETPDEKKVFMENEDKRKRLKEDNMRRRKRREMKRRQRAEKKAENAAAKQRGAAAVWKLSASDSSDDDGLGGNVGSVYTRKVRKRRKGGGKGWGMSKKKVTAVIQDPALRPTTSHRRYAEKVREDAKQDKEQWKAEVMGKIERIAKAREKLVEAEGKALQEKAAEELKKYDEKMRIREERRKRDEKLKKARKRLSIKMAKEEEAKRKEEEERRRKKQEEREKWRRAASVSKAQKEKVKRKRKEAALKEREVTEMQLTKIARDKEKYRTELTERWKRRKEKEQETKRLAAKQEALERAQSAHRRAQKLEKYQLKLAEEEAIRKQQKIEAYRKDREDFRMKMARRKEEEKKAEEARLAAEARIRIARAKEMAATRDAMKAPKSKFDYTAIADAERDNGNESDDTEYDPYGNKVKKKKKTPPSLGDKKRSQLIRRVSQNTELGKKKKKKKKAPQSAAEFLAAAAAAEAWEETEPVEAPPGYSDDDFDVRKPTIEKTTKIEREKRRRLEIKNKLKKARGKGSRSNVKNSQGNIVKKMLSLKIDAPRRRKVIDKKKKRRKKKKKDKTGNEEKPSLQVIQENEEDLKEKQDDMNQNILENVVLLPPDERAISRRAVTAGTAVSTQSMTRRIMYADADDFFISENNLSENELSESCESLQEQMAQRAAAASARRLAQQAEKEKVELVYKVKKRKEKQQAKARAKARIKPGAIDKEPVPTSYPLHKGASITRPAIPDAMDTTTALDKVYSARRMGSTSPVRAAMNSGRRRNNNVLSPYSPRRQHRKIRKSMTQPENDDSKPQIAIDAGGIPMQMTIVDSPTAYQKVAEDGKFDESDDEMFQDLAYAAEDGRAVTRHTEKDSSMRSVSRRSNSISSFKESKEEDYPSFYPDFLDERAVSRRALTAGTVNTTTSSNSNFIGILYAEAEENNYSGNDDSDGSL